MSAGAGVNFDAVGFTAAATTDADYIAGDVIQFPRAVANIGSHYNESTGVFTCPVTGMYHMQLSVLSANSTSAQVSIVHQASAVGTAFGDTADMNQGATSAVFVCNAGEEVWTEAAAATGVSSDSTGLYNVFSGYLVYPV